MFQLFITTFALTAANRRILRANASSVPPEVFQTLFGLATTPRPDLAALRLVRVTMHISYMYSTTSISIVKGKAL